jgi:hypothetical protein
VNAETTVVRGGRPTIPVAPAGDGLRLAGLLLSLPLRLLSSPLGRRLAATAALSLVLVGLVTALYANADGAPASAGRSLGASPAAAGRRLASPRASFRPATRPDQAAVAWFAAQQHVAADRVQALQQRKVSNTVRRVLVMAEVGASRLPSAYVTVRRGPAGWAVS